MLIMSVFEIDMCIFTQMKLNVSYFNIIQSFCDNNIICCHIHVIKFYVLLLTFIFNSFLLQVYATNNHCFRMKILWIIIDNTDLYMRSLQ